MRETPHEHRPDHVDEATVSTAPELPTQALLVRAVRALESLKGWADTGLLVLEHCPRDEEQIQRAINGAIEQVNIASQAIWHLSHLRSTKGQA